MTDLLPPRLTAEDIERIEDETRAELGLPPREKKKGDSHLLVERPNLAFKPPGYFHVEQTYIDNPMTGERRAALIWTNPAGEKRGYTETIHVPQMNVGVMR